MKKRWIPLVALCIAGTATAQERHEINFPDLPGYHVLVCDLHTHTVFSDGLVWPSVRIDEAWRLGLDAIAITDHIEYQPHRDDIPTNHNRPFVLVQERAQERGLLLPRGTEITRDTPPGHFNGIFLDDVDPVDTTNFVDAVKAANEQDGFVFWNHQGWKGPELGRWMDVHTLLLTNGWLHGMEVANADEYYPDAHQWCLDHGLTMLGNSDIHEPDLNHFSHPEKHRSLTLVFARERTLEGLKEALRAGRTVVWYQDQLIGRETWLRPLIERCVQVTPIRNANGRMTSLRIVNDSDIPVRLRRISGMGPEELTLEPGSLQRLKVTIPDGGAQFNYEATNLLVAPGRGLICRYSVPDS